jgi:3-methyladenine DNA glycosylase AlkD
MQLKEILHELKKMGDPKVKKIKERFVIVPPNSYGIFLKDLNILARRIGKNDELAIKLFDTGVYEARLLTSMLFNPQNLTERLMEKWVKAFDNWEICDTFCMNVFGKSRFAVKKAFAWAEKKPEYQKRAGFVCMVQYAFTNQEAPNNVFEKFFPVIIKHASDERTYVMKGINWALRQIGKRNKNLYKEALEVADEILKLDSKPARWIAKDAIRQLKKPNVAMKNYPKNIYGKK